MKSQMTQSSALIAITGWNAADRAPDNSAARLSARMRVEPASQAQGLPEIPVVSGSGQKTFVESLLASVTRAVGALVATDLAAKETRLLASNIQKQLGARNLPLVNGVGSLAFHMFG